MATSGNLVVELGRWDIREDFIAEYLAAVDDGQKEYGEHRLVPPLALTALALGALLEKLNMPKGAIHSLQEVETRRGLQWGETVAGTATLQRPRRRGNLHFITAEYVITDHGGAPAQVGKTTVLVTMEAGS